MFGETSFEGDVYHPHAKSMSFPDQTVKGVFLHEFDLQMAIIARIKIAKPLRHENTATTPNEWLFRNLSMPARVLGPFLNQMGYPVTVAN